MPDTRWTDNDRFKKEYGFLSGRKEIATKDLEGDYEKIRPLVVGIGGLNEGIFLVRNKKTGRRYVQKEVDPNIPQLLRELLLLQALDHPNIIRYIDAFIDKSLWYHHRASVYLEYCSFKSARDMLVKYQKHNRDLPGSFHTYIPERFIWHTFRSLAMALQYLHFGIKPDDKRTPEELDPLVKDPQYCQKVWPIILHRDIKPDNIFFRKTQPVRRYITEPRKFLKIFPRQKQVYSVKPQLPRVILADFGIAVAQKDPDWNGNRSYVGTLEWMPPELPESFVHSDVWAVGAIILAMCRQMPEGVVKPPPPGWTQGEEAWSLTLERESGIMGSASIIPLTSITWFTSV